MLLTVKCPKCGRGTVINGRGRCRCGARLWHHWAGRNIVTDRTWFMVNGEWTKEMM